MTARAPAVVVDRAAMTACVGGVVYVVRLTRRREPDGSFGDGRLLHVLGTGGRRRVGCVEWHDATRVGVLLPAASIHTRAAMRQEVILRALATAWFESAPMRAGGGT